MGSGDGEEEGASGVELAFGADGATLGADHVAGDGETEAGAA